MQVSEQEKDAWTYYCCRSEAVSRGLKEGALCNKPNKEVIDRSTGRSPPARTDTGAFAMARFCVVPLSVARSTLWVSVSIARGSQLLWTGLGMEEQACVSACMQVGENKRR